MHYRTFGKLDFRPSALGFGCMRLPCSDAPFFGAKVDEAQAIAMIRRSIDEGINYLDTAYPYHDGNSERVLGKALRNGYRTKVRLASKSPIWLIEKPSDFDRYLDEQLVRLQDDHIDFYLLHALSAERWPVVERHGVLERAEAALKAGKIGGLGFSFHGYPESFPKIVDAYGGWVCCQIQYNYMDTEYQAGQQGLAYAAAKGLAVIVMEPLRGGALANPPRAVRKVFDASPIKRSPAEWALRWVWRQPQVSLALSGMTTMDQLAENLRVADEAAADSLSAEELEVVDCARREFEKMTAIPCTQCRYCLPCPHGVDIPLNFEHYNTAVMYDDLAAARFRYGRFMAVGSRASDCNRCRECEAKCPQHIPISTWLPKAAALLGGSNQPE